MIGLTAAVYYLCGLLGLLYELGRHLILSIRQKITVNVFYGRSM